MKIECRMMRFKNHKPRANKPMDRVIFSYSFGNDLYRWGAVAKANIAYGRDVPCHLLYFFSDASGSHDDVPELSPERLAIPPCITNAVPWRQGLFQNKAGVFLRDDQILPQHCLWYPPANEFYDEDDNLLPAYKYPCGKRMLSGILGIEEALLEAALCGCWAGAGMRILWPASLARAIASGS